MLWISLLTGIWVSTALNALLWIPLCLSQGIVMLTFRRDFKMPVPISSVVFEFGLAAVLFAALTGFFWGAFTRNLLTAILLSILAPIVATAAFMAICRAGASLVEWLKRRNSG